MKILLVCTAQPARLPKRLRERITTRFGTKRMDFKELIDSYGVADVFFCFFLMFHKLWSLVYSVLMYP